MFYGKHTKKDGKSPYFMGKSTNGKTEAGFSWVYQWVLEKSTGNLQGFTGQRGGPFLLEKKCDSGGMVIPCDPQNTAEYFASNIRRE